MSDLSGVVNEQKTTIEDLRRRVAELEGERDRWKSAHHEMVNRNKLLRDRPDLPIERLQAYKQITAENAELKRRVAELERGKATPRQFFSYDPDDGFEEFDTAEEAKAHAETSLDLWRDSAGDGWSDESMRVCWGIICQSIRIVNQQEYDPEKHVFVSPDCAWVEERILCSEDASKEISRLEAENAELKRQAGKWKEYSDYHDMIADEFATENAELKRQVESLEAQLAARNQAAEAMGVLERLVPNRDTWASIERDYKDPRTWRVIHNRFDTEVETERTSEAHSLIEAVLKAGGEG